jgi:hypothetical protein
MKVAERRRIKQDQAESRYENVSIGTANNDCPNLLTGEENMASYLKKKTNPNL